MLLALALSNCKDERAARHIGIDEIFIVQAHSTYGTVISGFAMRSCWFVFLVCSGADGRERCEASTC